MRERPASNISFGRWLVGCGVTCRRSHGVARYTIPTARVLLAAVLTQAGIA
jgi:hypothetical protein